MSNISELCHSEGVVVATEESLIHCWKCFAPLSMTSFFVSQHLITASLTHEEHA